MQNAAYKIRHINWLTSSSAFSLLELLLALFIFNLAIFLSFPALAQSALYKKQAREKNEEQVLIQRAFLEVARGIDAAQVFYAIDGVRVYPDAKSLFADAKPDSSAMSFLHLSPLLLRKISEGQFCLEKPEADEDEKELIAETDNWLALGSGGYSSLKGDMRRLSKAPSSCLSGQAYTAIISSEQIFTHLVPVLDHYSLYLDNENRLRRFSHILNSRQTLLTNLKEFKATLEDSLRHGALIKIRVKTEKDYAEEKLFLYGTDEEQSIEDIIL